MKEINIAKVLSDKRRENGITQDELAGYIGVSKASVSKWETGQSYPDVTFLPILAAYFNITIDELLDYKPQMTKEDIKKLYKRLSLEFTTREPDTVLQECRAVVKKYYSCFPLLLQLGILMINHIELIKDPQEAAALILEAKALFVRVREESSEMGIKKKALFMEALCCIASNNPEAALELLDGTVEDAIAPEVLMASAYQMTGRISEAKSVLQIGIYQNIVVLFNYFPSYLMLCADDPVKFKEVLRRAFAVSEAFDLKNLHPSVLCGFYICAAQGFAAQGNTEKSIELLRSYTELVTGDIYPLCLHGDGFFDLLDDWLKKLDIGDALPRNEKTIRKSMVSVVSDNPAFSAFSDDQRFKNIVARLQSSSPENGR